MFNSYVIYGFYLFHERFALMVCSRDLYSWTHLVYHFNNISLLLVLMCFEFWDNKINRTNAALSLFLEF